MLNQFPVENAQVQQDFFQISSQSISDKRNYTEIYSIQVPKRQCFYIAFSKLPQEALKCLHLQRFCSHDILMIIAVNILT